MVHQGSVLNRDALWSLCQFTGKEYLRKSSSLFTGLCRDLMLHNGIQRMAMWPELPFRYWVSSDSQSIKLCKPSRVLHPWISSIVTSGHQRTDTRAPSKDVWVPYKFIFCTDIYIQVFRFEYLESNMKHSPSIESTVNKKQVCSVDSKENCLTR